MPNSVNINLFFFLFLFLSKSYHLIIFFKLLFLTDGLYCNANQFLNCCCLSFRNKSLLYLLANRCDIIQNLFKGMKSRWIESYNLIFLCFNAINKPFCHDFLSPHKKHIVEYLKDDYNIIAYKMQDSFKDFKSNLPLDKKI